MLLSIVTALLRGAVKPIVTQPVTPLSAGSVPNAQWRADYKGGFNRTVDPLQTKIRFVSKLKITA